jgi:N-acetylglutamate synthase-like GNAT family acetyltransferase
MTTDVLSLRRSTPDDTSAVDQLLRDSYTRLLKADYPPSTQVTAVPILARANPALLASGTYYLAVTRDDRIVGAGGWTHNSGREGAADIRHVVTDHRMQRRGIARRLMMGIISEARQAGIRRLDCLSTRTAHLFYEAMGFETLGTVTINLRPGIEFPVIRMRRML